MRIELRETVNVHLTGTINTLVGDWIYETAVKTDTFDIFIHVCNVK